MFKSLPIFALNHNVSQQRMYYFDLIPKPLAFRGYGEYAVIEMEGKGWVWLNIITNITMAMLQSETVDSFPIGRLTWKAKVKRTRKKKMN